MAIPVRQPLAYMVVVVTGQSDSVVRQAPQIMDEVNIKALIILDRQDKSVKVAGESRYAQQGLRDMKACGVLVDGHS